MILSSNTPGLTAALAYNSKIMAEGRWPESLGLPSSVDDAAMERLDAIMNGALIIELEDRMRRDNERQNETTSGDDSTTKQPSLIGLTGRARAGKDTA